MHRTVRPAALAGTVRVPGDKSIGHRALMFGALAAGTSRIHDLPDSADCRATRRLAEALGALVRDEPSGETVVESPGLDNLSEPDNVLDAANSGTTTRLFAGILATRSFLSTITGDASLRARPMGRVVEPLRRMGATIDGRDDGRLLPLSIRGGSLQGIDSTPTVASAQVKSAILLAGLRASGSTRVTDPLPSRDHTERMLAFTGVDVRARDGGVEISGGATPHPFTISVPGDISSAAFFLAAATLASEDGITMTGVGVNPTRTGILEVLHAMGAPVEVTPDGDHGPEPTATLRASRSALRAVEISGALVPRLVDEIPLIALLATQAEGRTIIRDAADLRAKESDRLTVIATELTRLGARITEHDDGLSIEGPRRLTGAVCQAHGDHRIAMVLAVAGLIAAGETTIDGAECVDVSYPHFFEDLRRLGGRVE